MNDCVTLKDEIETLIQKGKLTKYKCYNDQGKSEECGWSHSPWRKEMNDKMKQVEQQILEIVETIARGFARRGISNNARKRYLWAFMNSKSKKWKGHYKPIYFIEEDFGDIEREHDDPMVISALIHNFLVKQVLINQGSSTNILYSHAVEALGIPKSLYKLYNSVLVGFTGGRL